MTTTSLSFTRRLQIYLFIPVVVLIVLAALVSALVANRSVSELYDKQLNNNAEILIAFLHFELLEGDYDDDESDENEGEDEDEDDEEDSNDDDQYENVFESDDELTEELVEVVAQIEQERGFSVNYRFAVGQQILFTSKLVQHFPACANGYSMVEEDWRCYRLSENLMGAKTPLTVEFFEPMAQRRAAIRELIFSTYLPLLLLPVLLALATWWAVRRGIKPLRTMSQQIGERSVDNLERLDPQNQPIEFHPVLNAVNGLLGGIERGLIKEKQFTDDAAHQLRTPLTSIAMTEQLLRRENKDKALLPLLDNLRDSTDQSAQLIEQSLQFARLQTAKNLQKVTLNIEHVIRTQLGLLSNLLTEKELSIDLNQQGELTVLANQAAVELLLNNLLTNAIKFSPHGGTIYILIESTGLRIEDDGAGIAAAETHRIFDRFYRAPGTAHVQGNGLGLALAKWVADAHQFELRVTKPLQGSGAAFELVML